MMMKIVAAMMMITGVTAAPMHADRIAEIAEIQEKTQLWVAGETRFSAFPPGFGTKWLNGVIGNVKVAVAVALAKGEIERFVPANPELDIPESFDVAENWPECAKIINDIRDQSNCGCCWAFGGAEAASDRMCIATNGAVQIPISAQDVCFNSNKNGCGGGQITTPWTYIKETGAVSGGQYNNSGPFGDVGLCADFSLPHCHHHGPQGNDPYPDEGDAGCPSQKSPEGPTQCDSDSQSPHDDFQADKYSMDAIQVATGEEDIQRMIMEGGSVETAFTVYADFENYVSGIYEHVTGGPSGGHAVKFVGWGVDEATGTKYWKVANSWNPYWGESGYFRIVRGVNECGIEDEVTGASASASWTKADAKLN